MAFLVSCRPVVDENGLALVNTSGECTQNLVCGEWDACLNNQRSRQCEDTNKCDAEFVKSEYQECESEPLVQELEKPKIGEKEAEAPKEQSTDISSAYLPTGGFNPRAGQGSQINIRTSSIGGIEVYYEGYLQGKTAPIENGQFGYLIDKLSKKLPNGESHVTVGYHNVYLIKNSVVLLNKTIYVGPQNFTSRGEWIYYSQNQ